MSKAWHDRALLSSNDERDQLKALVQNSVRLRDRNSELAPERFALNTFMDPIRIAEASDRDPLNIAAAVSTKAAAGTDAWRETGEPISRTWLI